MAVKPPSIEGIISAIPGIRDVSLIDKGGYKAVFKANINGVQEALKFIEIPAYDELPEEDRSREQAELRSRIFREIDILEKINIPEIVKIASIKKTETNIENRNYIFYSEELIEGTDLRHIIDANGMRPEEPELRQLLITLLYAINKLWLHGVIHRDIKPANIMKTNNPQRPFILMDLGIAFAVDETGITSNTAKIPGTLLYIAPEMLYRGFRKIIDFRSDIYATGVTVYEYAAFKHPLTRESDDIGTTFYNILKKKPKRLKELRIDLSGVFCGWIDSMMKKTPALRPSNIEAIIKSLEARI